jgi:hypothetical protein
MNKQLLIENLEKKTNMILYFNSGGCGPCIQAKPYVNKITESKPDYLFADIKVGSEDSIELEKFCNVEFYPTLVIIENNKINRYVGINEIKTL